MQLKDKQILILSPQPWNSLFISKQHYAMELARHNRVIFVPAPGHALRRGLRRTRPIAGLNLELITYSVMLPGSARFHLPRLYKAVVQHTLSGVLSELMPSIDLCIDFGCYQQYDRIDWIGASRSVFFPVDDQEKLRVDMRGADVVCSVSENILQKFRQAGLPCTFINHGLSKDFELMAHKRLEDLKPWTRGDRVRIAYSGNLFIPFLDIPVFRKLIDTYREVEFHFFGGLTFNPANETHREWSEFLHRSPHVVLHGFLQPAALAEAFDEMDLLLICYKPDYKNWHGENSHKIMEYLSTGKALVTSYLSLYQDVEWMEMAAKDRNEELVDLLGRSIAQLERLNQPEFRKQRILFALDNTYGKQVERLGSLIDVELAHSV